MKCKVKNALLFTLQRGKLNFEKKQKGVCENERSISYYIRRFLRSSVGAYQREEYHSGSLLCIF